MLKLSFLRTKWLYLTTIIGSVIIVSAADAATIKLECKNPRRAYQLILNVNEKTLIARTQTEEDVLYPIERLLFTNEGYAVFGRATSKGPYFELVIGKQSDITFLLDADKKQVDACIKI